MNTIPATIQLHRDSLPVDVPAGYIGPLTLPGNGRMVWWTGRVAIGLRHQPYAGDAAFSQSALWIQGVLLGDERRERAAA